MNEIITGLVNLPPLEGKVVRRTDGDLTIEGSHAWMPGSREGIYREVEWLRKRLAEILAAWDYLESTK